MMELFRNEFIVFIFLSSEIAKQTSSEINPQLFAFENKLKLEL